MEKENSNPESSRIRNLHEVLIQRMQRVGRWVSEFAGRIRRKDQFTHSIQDTLVADIKNDTIQASEIDLLKSPYGGEQYDGEETNEEERIKKEIRLHTLIKSTIEDHSPNFKPQNVNIPFCGPAVASEAVILQAIYGANLHISATDINQQYVLSGKSEVVRLQGVGLPMEGITIELGDSRRDTSYETPTNLIFARNLPFPSSVAPEGGWNIDSLREAFQKIHSELSDEGYFVVSAFSRDRYKETKRELLSAGFDLVSILDEYPATDREQVREDQRGLGPALGDFSVFICRKKIANSLEGSV